MLFSSKYLWLYLLIFVVALLASGIEFSQSLYSYNTHRLIEFFLFLVLPVVILTSSLSLPNKKIITITIIIFLAAGLNSSIYSEDPVKSLTGVWLLASILLAALCFYQEELSTQFIATVATLITACFTIYICVFYLDLVMDMVHSKATIKGSRLNHGYDNPRFLNQIQTLCIPLAIISIKFLTDIQLLSPGFKKFITFLLYFSSSTYIALVFMTAGRGTIISSLIAIILLWLILGKSYNYVGKRILLLWLGGLILYLIIIYFYPVAIEVNVAVAGNDIARYSDNGRLALWSLALDLIKHHPITGVGPLMYGSQLSIISNHPHNAVLWFASEWGVIAGVAIVFFVGYLLALYICRLRISAKLASEVSTITTTPLSLIVGQVLASSLIAGAVHSLLSGSYIIPSSQLTALLIVILSLSNYQTLGRRVAANNPVKISSSLYVRLALFLMMVLLLIPVFQYHQAGNWGQIELKEINYEGRQLAPAYWLQGDR